MNPRYAANSTCAANTVTYEICSYGGVLIRVRMDKQINLKSSYIDDDDDDDDDVDDDNDVMTRLSIISLSFSFRLRAST